MTKIKNRNELTKARKTYAAALQKQKKRIYVCSGTGCLSSGALTIFNNLKKSATKSGLSVQVSLEEDKGADVGIKKSGCHGFCQIGPLVRIEPSGYVYSHVSPSDVDEIIEKSILGNEFIARLGYKDEAGHACKCEKDIPFYKRQSRTVLENSGAIDATSIHEYLAVGGYGAFEKALFEMTPAEVVSEIKESHLRGRGGGGFPTGRKWEQVASQKETKRYVVCNGDEGDPGAFMDMSIMEGDPHRMIEGMLISAYACGADTGYIYVRAEYPKAVERLETAIAQCKKTGIMGKNILGTDFSFDLLISQGAGAFVCGEGSALTASIEGNRGMPRVKPPRTVEQGLFGKPTTLNNVETFANVPLIIEHGAKWYLGIGTESSPGTKAFSVTGNIVNTGLIEVEMGSPLRKVIFDIGGGIEGGKKFKAVQIGGPSGACLTEEHLDLPLDFDSLKSVGAMIGSGGLVVMNEDTCMVEVARFFMSFTQRESCGKCVPCREGTKRMLEILERIVSGRGVPEDITMLKDLGEMITDTSLCGLGKTAASPVLSTLKHFMPEYEAHIYEKRCPAGSCSHLAKIAITPSLCKGCSKCEKVCPVEAITGKIKEPYVIDGAKCIKCEACISECPFGAITKG